MKKIVTVILINYCCLSDTIECLKSLKLSDYDCFDICLIDNYSQDRSETALREYISDLGNALKIVFIQSGYNGGFSYGVNIGIRYAEENKSDYVLLLNPDMIVQKDMLSSLVNCAEKYHERTMVTGCIPSYAADGGICYPGNRINYFTKKPLEDKKPLSCEKEVALAAGCLLLIPMEIIKTVGYWDERYFMYFEDMDYSYKVKKAGYKIICTPKAIAYHKVSASSKCDPEVKIFYNMRGKILFLYTHHRLYFFPYIIFIYIKTLLKFFLLREKIVGLRLDAIRSAVSSIMKERINK